MKKRTQKFPSPKELDRIYKKIVKKEPTYILPPDAGAVDRAKYEVCKHILIFMHGKKLNQRKLAQKMEVPESRISEIVHYKIDKFTLDKLVTYYEKLNPNLSVNVA